MPKLPKEWQVYSSDKPAPPSRGFWRRLGARASGDRQSRPKSALLRALRRKLLPLVIYAACGAGIFWATFIDKPFTPNMGLSRHVNVPRDCDAARAAGMAPLIVGQPGYHPKLDADGDGIACEWNPSVEW